jgi:hypothetical protein
MLGLGRGSNVDVALRLDIRARSMLDDDEAGLLPSLATCRAWFDASAVAVDAAHDCADEEMQEDAGADDADDDAARAVVMASDGRTLDRAGALALLRRAFEHAEPRFASSPVFLAMARRCFDENAGDSAAEIGASQRVTFRWWLNNPFGSLAEALHDLTRD